MGGGYAAEIKKIPSGLVLTLWGGLASFDSNVITLIIPMSKVQYPAIKYFLCDLVEKEESWMRDSANSLVC